MEAIGLRTIINYSITLQFIGDKSILMIHVEVKPIHSVLANSQYVHNDDYYAMRTWPDFASARLIY